MGAVEITDFDLCVRRTIHKGRIQQWGEYTADLESKLETEETTADRNESILESKGLFDIQSLIRNRNRKNNCRSDELACGLLEERNPGSPIQQR